LTKYLSLNQNEDIRRLKLHTNLNIFVVNRLRDRKPFSPGIPPSISPNGVRYIGSDIQKSPYTK